MNAINPLLSVGLTGTTPIGATSPRPQVAAAEDGPLGNVFSNILNEITRLDSEAASLEKAMYAGGPIELHQVVIAGEKAGVAFELLVEARNRLVEAYQELMRMPV
ncbi:MAG TPA: flagellar hook-basal body complex protein FliE [Acidobacteriota bacterium]|nr:flagellar hook-basal body complex protein FliE [Acidobacteriota bacterium]